MLGSFAICSPLPGKNLPQSLQDLLLKMLTLIQRELGGKEPEEWWHLETEDGFLQGWERREPSPQWDRRQCPGAAWVTRKLCTLSGLPQSNSLVY